MAPQRVADAANISPYPFVVRQERQANPAPDNANRPPKGKKAKARPRAERNPRQEEEIRFNTGPRNLRAPQSRRGFRFPGRGYGDDRNGVPDYPPPSFQEAINTPAVSVCSSTVSLVPPRAVALLIPEDIPENIPEHRYISSPSERLLVDPDPDPLNETTASDNGSDSDESMFIINKNEIPVGSTDLPRGHELEERVKKDWLRRRGVEFPTKPPTLESPKPSEENHLRGRAVDKRPRLSIDPVTANSQDHEETSPLSSPKRRFLSLSPLRTIFPPKSAVHEDRAMSAHPTPTHSPYAGSSRSFFRSTTSLATSSFLRLPTLSSGGSPGKSESISRKLFSHKGKEKAKAPETRDETWEVVDQSAYAGVDKEGVERRAEHPRSLMSALESMSMNDSTTDLGNSPTRSLSFTFGSQRTSDRLRASKQAYSPSVNVVYGSQSIGSPSTTTLSTLREKGHPTAFIDRQLNRRSIVPSSPSIPELPETLASPTYSSMEPPTPTSDTTSTLSPNPLTAVRARQPSPHRTTPPPSVRHVAHSPSPLRVENLAISQAAAVMYQRALDTPLPDTPVHFEHPVSPNVNEALPPFVLASDPGPVPARYVPHLQSDSISAPQPCSCNVHPTNTTRIPSPPLSITVHPLATPYPPPPAELYQANLTSDEPMTPTTPKHHYVGRPLPRPPPTITRGRAGIVDSTYASSPESSSGADSSKLIPEGLLIDLEDTTFDDISVSGTSTPRTDEGRFRSQAHLPLIPMSPSSVNLAPEAAADLSSISFASMQATSTPILSAHPGARQAPYPVHQAYQQQPQHQLLQHPQPRQGPRYSELTDLDLLVSRLTENAEDGSDYDVSPSPQGWQEPALNHRMHDLHHQPDSASGFRGTWTREPHSTSRLSPVAGGYHQQYLPVDTHYQRQYVAHRAY